MHNGSMSMKIEIGIKPLQIKGFYSII